MKVTVRYVDGSERTVGPHDWGYVRSDGVDWVDVYSGTNADRIQGHSVYWLRRDNGTWAAGGGIVGAAASPEEVVINPDGARHRRQLQYMPDLDHGQVKLGWWLPKEGDR